jgi:hypothetical protein
MRSIERVLFEGIYIDRLYIYIGRDRLLRDLAIGLYNQVANWMLERRGLLDKFMEWLEDNHKEIEIWEAKVLGEERPNILGLLFRMRYRGSSCIEFYKLSGAVWCYVGDTNDRGLYRLLMRELQYSRVVNGLVIEHNLFHPLDIGIKDLDKMIRDGIRYGVIPELNNIDVVFSPDNEIDLKDELNAKYYRHVNGIQK